MNIQIEHRTFFYNEGLIRYGHQNIEQLFYPPTIRHAPINPGDGERRNHPAYTLDTTTASNDIDFDIKVDNTKWDRQIKIAMQ